jgi:hypothetical protein
MHVVHTFEVSELITAKQVDVYVDPLFKVSDLCVHTTNVQEEFDIATSHDGGKSLANR